MNILQECPKELPDYIGGLLEEAAKKWYECDLRPRISNDSLKHWDGLVDEWIQDKSVPILVRKSNGRGSKIKHKEGRTIILTDNTPANWSFSMAYQGYSPDLNEIKDLLTNDKIPIVFAISAEDKGKVVMKGNRRKDFDINQKGWKVCHIEEVGLRTRKKINDIPLAFLEEHFRRLISPSNMFLVPKTLSGLGELPQVVNVMRRGL